MWIQILLLLGIVGTVLPLTRGAAGARHQAVRRLLLVGFVILAVFAVLFPNLLSDVANMLGVGRGTDLLLYLLVIAFLSYVATSYRRLGAFDQRVTVLTRKLALAEARVRAQESTAVDLEQAVDEPRVLTAGGLAPSSTGVLPGEVPPGTVFDPDPKPLPATSDPSAETAMEQGSTTAER